MNTTHRVHAGSATVGVSAHILQPTASVKGVRPILLQNSQAVRGRHALHWSFAFPISNLRRQLNA